MVMSNKNLLHTSSKKSEHVSINDNESMWELSFINWLEGVNGMKDTNLFALDGGNNEKCNLHEHGVIMVVLAAHVCAVIANFKCMKMQLRLCKMSVCTFWSKDTCN